MILCVRKYSKAPKCMNFLPTEGHLEQVMLYDGVCNLCNGWVNFVIDRDKQSRYKFAALQGEAGRAMMTRVGKSEFFFRPRIMCNFSEPYCSREFSFARVYHQLTEHNTCPHDGIFAGRSG